MPAASPQKAAPIPRGWIPETVTRKVTAAGRSERPGTALAKAARSAPARLAFLARAHRGEDDADHGEGKQQQHTGVHRLAEQDREQRRDGSLARDGRRDDRQLALLEGAEARQIPAQRQDAHADDQHRALRGNVGQAAGEEDDRRSDEQTDGD